jgi:hypothetical protein
LPGIFLQFHRCPQVCLESPREEQAGVIDDLGQSGDLATLPRGLNLSLELRPQALRIEHRAGLIAKRHGASETHLRRVTLIRLSRNVQLNLFETHGHFEFTVGRLF